jgi:hypothetical protein
MSEQGQDLRQRIEEQVQQTAQDFFGESIDSIKTQLANQRSQLQEIVEMLPESQESGRAQLEQLLGSYEELENNLDEVAQEQGVQEAVNQAVQQAQEETAGQAQEGAEQATEQAQETAEQGQEGAEQASEQTQETAGQATEQAQGAVGQATEQVQEGANQEQ